MTVLTESAALDRLYPEVAREPELIKLGVRSRTCSPSVLELLRSVPMLDDLGKPLPPSANDTCTREPVV
jgi:hypothetical protein